MHTKGRINIATFLAEPNPFKKLLGDQLDLKIFCADDEYYNQEALQLIFNKLKLMNFVTMVSDGNQLIQRCVQTAERYINS